MNEPNVKKWEMDYMKEFARGRQDHACDGTWKDELRCLWTAYCLHNGLTPDMPDYRRELDELRGATGSDGFPDPADGDTPGTAEPNGNGGKTFLVQKLIEGDLYHTICTETELINYVSMSDCYDDEEYRIFDISRFASSEEVFYKGWQRGGLIEIVDNRGRTVAEGYGTEH